MVLASAGFSQKTLEIHHLGKRCGRGMPQDHARHSASKVEDGACPAFFGVPLGSLPTCTSCWGAWHACLPEAERNAHDSQVYGDRDGWVRLAPTKTAQQLPYILHPQSMSLL